MLQRRFAKQRGCDVAAVRVTERNAQEYVAEGCGERAEYLCESFAGMNADETRCRELGGADKRPRDDKYRARRDLEPPK
jgi:hypothetical protein